jgi:hypothetical protein
MGRVSDGGIHVNHTKLFLDDPLDHLVRMLDLHESRKQELVNVTSG